MWSASQDLQKEPDRLEDRIAVRKAASLKLARAQVELDEAEESILSGRRSILLWYEECCLRAQLSVERLLWLIGAFPDSFIGLKSVTGMLAEIGTIIRSGLESLRGALDVSMRPTDLSKGATSLRIRFSERKIKRLLGTWVSLFISGHWAGVLGNCVYREMTGSQFIPGQVVEMPTLLSQAEQIEVAKKLNDRDEYWSRWKWINQSCGLPPRLEGIDGISEKMLAELERAETDCKNDLVLSPHRFVTNVMRNMIKAEIVQFLFDKINISASSEL